MPEDLEGPLQDKPGWIGRLKNGIKRITDYDRRASQKQYETNLRDLHEKYSLDSWTKEGFVFEDELTKSSSPFIEVAGPTPEGFELLDTSKLTKKLLVSNITPGLENWDHSGKESVLLGHQYEDQLDFRADARQLPFAKESVGLLVTAYPTNGISPSLIIEAHRVIKQGGYLLWEGALDNDVLFLLSHGFEIMKYTKEKVTWSVDPIENAKWARLQGTTVWKLVLKKPEEPIQ